MTTTTKTTKREMFEAIKTVAASMETFSENVTSEMVVEFCDKEIAALDNKAAKAKERAAAKKAEGDELTDAVLAAMSTEEFQCIADIAANTDGDEVTVAKVQYRLNTLVKAGLAVKEDITISSVDAEGKTKKRTVKGYKAVVTD